MGQRKIKIDRTRRTDRKPIKNRQPIGCCFGQCIAKYILIFKRFGSTFDALIFNWFQLRFRVFRRWLLCASVCLSAPQSHIIEGKQITKKPTILCCKQMTIKICERLKSCFDFLIYRARAVVIFFPFFFLAQSLFCAWWIFFHQMDFESIVLFVWFIKCCPIYVKCNLYGIYRCSSYQSGVQIGIGLFSQRTEKLSLFLFGSIWDDMTKKTSFISDKCVFEQDSLSSDRDHSQLTMILKEWRFRTNYRRAGWLVNKWPSNDKDTLAEILAISTPLTRIKRKNMKSLARNLRGR